MSVSEAARDFVDETVESTELATRNGFHLARRCRVCRNDPVRKKVNATLACGVSTCSCHRLLVTVVEGIDVLVHRRHWIVRVGHRGSPLPWCNSFRTLIPVLQPLDRREDRQRRGVDDHGYCRTAQADSQTSAVDRVEPAAAP